MSVTRCQEFKPLTDDELLDLEDAKLPINNAICRKILRRAEHGKKKYGSTVDRHDLSFFDWATHASEEFMDGLLYTEKCRRVATEMLKHVPDLEAMSEKLRRIGFLTEAQTIQSVVDLIAGVKKPALQKLDPQQD